MKNFIINISIKLIFVVFLVATLTYLISAGGKNVACASYWGGCGDASHQSCPSGIGAISECISSVNVNVGIYVQGDGMQSGTTFRVDLVSPACGEITCLKTNDTVYVGPYNGQITEMSTYTDKIGCSTGQCGPTDILKANAYYSSGGPKPGATCTITDQNGTPVPSDGWFSQNIFSMNGNDVSFVYIFKCTMPQNYTCNTTTTQSCQPTSCPANMTPNNSLTCAPGQVCCVQNACTTPLATPAPVVSCTL